MPSALPRPARSRLEVGAQVRRWRQTRRLTLAEIGTRTGLNVGYLSQIENDRASPSLAVLATIADALEVPPAWLLMSDIPAPTVVRAADRPVTTSDLGRIEFVDGRASREVSIVEVSGAPGGHVGLHVHAGDEHHIVLRGRFRMTQGEHVVELGPGDYLRWDGAVPHDGEIVGSVEGAMLIVRIRPKD